MYACMPCMHVCMHACMYVCTPVCTCIQSIIIQNRIREAGQVRENGGGQGLQKRRCAERVNQKSRGRSASFRNFLFLFHRVAQSQWKARFHHVHITSTHTRPYVPSNITANATVNACKRRLEFPRPRYNNVLCLSDYHTHSVASDPQSIPRDSCISDANRNNGFNHVTVLQLCSFSFCRLIGCVAL